jgi:ribosome-associated toxin RatA of RatAB toxin-antitoxin module
MAGCDGVGMSRAFCRAIGKVVYGNASCQTVQRVSKLLTRVFTLGHMGISATFRWAKPLAITALLAVAGHCAAAEIDIQTSHLGDVVSVRAQATIAAPLEVVWGTLTDYERLHEFVPGIKKSTVIARNGGTAIVQQSGEARFFLARVPIEVTLESTEVPPNIEVRRIAGTLKQLQGRYETQVMEGTPTRVQLRWIGSIEPENSLPPLIGEALMRRSIKQQFAGMVGEIERRELARHQGMSAASPNAAPNSSPNTSSNTLANGAASAQSAVPSIASGAASSNAVPAASSAATPVVSPAGNPGSSK